MRITERKLRQEIREIILEQSTLSEGPRLDALKRAGLISMFAAFPLLSSTVTDRTGPETTLYYLDQMYNAQKTSGAYSSGMSNEEFEILKTPIGLALLKRINTGVSKQNIHYVHDIARLAEQAIESIERAGDSVDIDSFKITASDMLTNSKGQVEIMYVGTAEELDDLVGPNSLVYYTLGKGRGIRHSIFYTGNKEDLDYARRQLESDNEDPIRMRSDESYSRKKYKSLYL